MKLNNFKVTLLSKEEAIATKGGSLLGYILKVLMDCERRSRSNTQGTRVL